MFYVLCIYGLIQQFMLLTNDDDINILLLFKFLENSGPIVGLDKRRVQMNPTEFESRDYNKITNEITFCLRKVCIFMDPFTGNLLFSI